MLVNYTCALSACQSLFSLEFVTMSAYNESTKYNTLYAR